MLFSLCNLSETKLFIFVAALLPFLASFIYRIACILRLYRIMSYKQVAKHKLIGCRTLRQAQDVLGEIIILGQQECTAVAITVFVEHTYLWLHGALILKYVV